VGGVKFCSRLEIGVISLSAYKGLKEEDRIFTPKADGGTAHTIEGLRHREERDASRSPLQISVFVRIEQRKTYQIVNLA